MLYLYKQSNVKKKVNILDEEDIIRNADEYFSKVSKRMEHSGKSAEEVIAEMEEEEKNGSHYEDLAIVCIKIGLKELETVLIADTEERDVNTVVGKALNHYIPEVIELKRYSSVKGLWKRLLSADSEKVWVLDGVENVTDEDIQQCIFYMLKREEYVPPTLHAEPIDFSKRKLILITKADDETKAYPPYCRGYSLSAVVVKV